MAYEHRIFIVEKTHDCYDAKLDKYFGKVICFFNLGAMEELHDIIKKYGPTDHFIYQPGNGDEEVVEDMYGDPLTEIPVEDLYDELVDMMANIGCRSSIYTLLLTLKGYNDIKQCRNNDFVCLHYGY
jgi:hypothetical protein